MSIILLWSIFVNIVFAVDLSSTVNLNLELEAWEMTITIP